MLQGSVLIALFLAITGILILVVRLVTETIQTQIPDRESANSREFRVDSDQTARGDCSARYYIIAAVAVVLLAQMIFLVPWAVKARALGIFGVIEMLVFLGVVITGYAWLWKKGAIEWA
jgi:NADH-quinone oxidoreductase subunit A